ncbi:MAG: RIP metalloprotease RseP [Bacteroidota bacterium]|nr:RIP metalloprotease RseP [Bacteroidota bacterium]
MHILNMILYTTITLGVLIFIHELGHFLAAKLLGMRVDRFSIGFPPRAFGKKIGDTDYCVSWIPIGGYVKIAGMVDESMDTEFANQKPEPWEYRSKPIWARMVVISAGVIMNILLAVAIFSSIHFVQGSYIAETTEVGYVVEESFFEKAGLVNGDKILSVNDKSVKHWDEILPLIYIENLGNDITLNVEREGRHVQIFIPAKTVPSPSQSQVGIMVAHTVAIIDGVELNMPASEMGLMMGDTILAVNDIQVTQAQVIKLIKANAGKQVAMKLKRGNEILTKTTTVTEEGRIGIRIGSRYIGPSKKIEYSIIGAVGEGLTDIKVSVNLFYLTISKIFSGKTSVKESLGGPIAIAQLATQSAEYGFFMFIWFMAQLSMSLAIINVLPIPALDGGHLIMLFFEKVFRREIPHKVKIAIQQAGLILLLAFMAFIIYNDISRF